MPKKIRLDLLLCERMPHYSRRQIQSWIMQGQVKIQGVVYNKTGAQVDPESEIEIIINEPKYVSRAGLKLEKALDYFNVDVTGLVALDAGLSTGGFTDCLLQRGIGHVYGVDVGYGQVHEKIRVHPRVTVMERTNLRTLSQCDLGQKVDLVTLDLSFISILKVVDTIDTVLKDQSALIALIKPQFEAQRHQVGKKGIIRDPAIHQEVIERVSKVLQEHGFTLHGVIESPITGSTGNKEFLVYATRKKL